MNANTTQNTTALGWLDAEDGPEGPILVAARRAHEIAERATGAAPSVWVDPEVAEQAVLRVSLERTAAQNIVPVGPAPQVSTYSGYDA